MYVCIDTKCVTRLSALVLLCTWQLMVLLTDSSVMHAEDWPSTSESDSQQDSVSALKEKIAELEDELETAT